VPSTEKGLNLNDEYITLEAIPTFPDAFPKGSISHFTHPEDFFEYPPEVGTVTDSWVEGDQAGVDIDFQERFAKNFEGNRRYDVSVYCVKVQDHYDGHGLRYIDAFLPDERNSIDIVPFGAVPAAKVGEKVSDSRSADDKSFRCTMHLEPILRRKDVDMTIEEITAAIQAGLGEAGAGKLSDEAMKGLADGLEKTVNDAVDKAVTDALAAQEPKPAEPDAEAMAKAVADSFKAGCEAGLTGHEVDIVLDAMRGGKPMKDAVADIKALESELKGSGEQDPAAKPLSDGLGATTSNGKSTSSEFDPMVALRKAWHIKEGAN
jgi:hypothetical protein